MGKGSLESVKTHKVSFGEPIVLEEDTRLDDTFVLVGLIDVHMVDRSPIGEVDLEVSLFVEKVG